MLESCSSLAGRAAATRGTASRCSLLPRSEALAASWWIQFSFELRCGTQERMLKRMLFGLAESSTSRLENPESSLLMQP